MTETPLNDSNIEPVKMDEYAREAYLENLADLMINASERCYHAMRIIGMDTEIPPRAYQSRDTGKPVEWGGDWIFPAEGAAMIILAEALGLPGDEWIT